MFPLRQLKAAIRAAVLAGYKVAVMSSHEPPRFNDKRVRWPGRHGVRRWLALMELAEFSITMESGPLHLTHVVDRPVICFYGPTRVTERGAFHPSYKKGFVVPIELNKLIKCPSCFMIPDRCSWRWRCIRETAPGTIEALTRKAIKKMETVLCS